jgi:hypothetical protein
MFGDLDNLPMGGGEVTEVMRFMFLVVVVAVSGEYCAGQQPSACLIKRNEANLSVQDLNKQLDHDPDLLGSVWLREVSIRLASEISSWSASFESQSDSELL